MVLGTPQCSHLGPPLPRPPAVLILLKGLTFNLHESQWAMFEMDHFLMAQDEGMLSPK